MKNQNSICWFLGQKIKNMSGNIKNSNANALNNSLILTENAKKKFLFWRKNVLQQIVDFWATKFQICTIIENLDSS